MLKQRIQEGDYLFPYHYLDLQIDEYKYIHHLEYLSKLSLVKSYVSPFENQRILEIGCGDGRLCYELKKENLRISGIDISKRAILFAKAFNPKLVFFNQKIESFKPDRKFSCILLIDTLEHIPKKEIFSFLKKISKLLDRKGTFIITVPTTNLELSKKHYQHFDERKIKKTLNPYFSIEKILGYHKKGPKYSFFITLKRVGLILLPLKNRFSFVKKYFSHLKKYYDKHISRGSPDNCFGMLILCKKK